MFCGKTKHLTFSFDDGVTQDRRMVKLLDKYGLKATFNLNSGRLGIGERHVTNEEIKELYANHEVAVHTVTHAALSALSEQGIILEVENDRKALEELTGYPVRGMAYPGVASYPLYTEEVMDTVEKYTKIQYARTTTLTYAFDYPERLLEIKPTAHFCKEPETLLELADRFIEQNAQKPMLFYIWGHSYELKNEDDWKRFEAFCEKISGNADVFYGTNSEILL